MKLPMSPIHDVDYILEIFRLHPITCPYLLILCKKSPSSMPILKEELEEVKKWRKVTIKRIDAGHDVHLVDPEVIAPIIIEFLLESEAKL